MRKSPHTDLTEDEIKAKMDQLGLALWEKDSSSFVEKKVDALASFNREAYFKVCKEHQSYLLEHMQASDERLFLWSLLTTFRDEGEV